MKYNWYCLASFLGWKGKNVAINTFTSFEALLIAPIMISEASREETREPATKPLSFLTLHNSVSFCVRLSRDFSRQSPKCLLAGYTVNSFNAFDGERGVAQWWEHLRILPSTPWCGLSLLFALSPALKVFSPDSSSVFPLSSNFNSIWNTRIRLSRG